MEKIFLLCVIAVNHPSSRHASGLPGFQQAARGTEQESSAAGLIILETGMELVPCCGHRHAAEEAGGKAHQNKRKQGQGFSARENTREERS